MRWLWIAIFAVGCGNGSTPGPDGAPPAGADARAAADAPPPDAGTGTADATPLGQLCVTTAADGGPGSCPAGTLCCSAGTTICRLPEDCPAGPGYKSCEHSPECQGSICCRLSSMQFCTKSNVCSSYGGVEVP